MQLEVFTSPGCSKCGRAKARLRDQVDAIGNGVHWREVDVVDKIDHSVDLGVLSVPAIAIDGELVFTGLPSAQRLHDELVRHLDIEPQ